MIIQKITRSYKGFRGDEPLVETGQESCEEEAEDDLRRRQPSRPSTYFYLNPGKFRLQKMNALARDETRRCMQLGASKKWIDALFALRKDSTEIVVTGNAGNMTEADRIFAVYKKNLLPEPIERGVTVETVERNNAITQEENQSVASRSTVDEGKDQNGFISIVTSPLTKGRRRPTVIVIEESDESEEEV